MPEKKQVTVTWGHFTIAPDFETNLNNGFDFNIMQEHVELHGRSGWGGRLTHAQMDAIAKIYLAIRGVR